MNGTINPNGVSTASFFEWGTSATLNTFTATPRSSFSTGPGTITNSCPLSGLSCGTTYYYRVVAVTEGGTSVRGNIVAVTTSACTSTPDFTVSASPVLRTISQGQSTTYAITVTSQNGFGGSVALNALNLPGNIIVSGTAFSPSTITVSSGSSATSTFTYVSSGTVPTGTFTMTVQAQAGSLIRSAPVTLTIIPVTADPSVIGIDPASPVATTERQTISVRGSGFQQGLIVRITFPSGQSGTLLGETIRNVTSNLFSMVINFNGNDGGYSIRVTNPDGRQSQSFSFTVAAIGTTGCSKSVDVNGVSIRANCITQIDSRTTKASGDVSLNDFLRFTGDLTIVRNGINATVSGSGGVYIDGVYHFGRVTLFATGSFQFNLDGGAALSNLIRGALSQELKLAGLSVEISNIHLLSDGVMIDGQLVLPPIVGIRTKINSLTITQSRGVEVAGGVTLPTFTLGGGITLRNTILSFDTGQDLFTGTASLETPLLIVSPIVSIKMGCLNRIGASIESKTGGILIPGTPVSITGGSLELNNLCEGNFAISIGTTLTIANPAVSRIVKLDNLRLTYTVPRTVVGDGSLKVFNKEVASGRISINDPSGVRLTGSLSLIEVIEGSLNLAIQAGSVNGSIDGSIQIPDDSRIPLYNQIRWLVHLPYKLESIHASVTNDRASAEIQLSRLLKLTASVIFKSDGSIDYEFGANFSIPLQFAAEVNAPLNQLALKQFNKGALAAEQRLEARGILIKAATQKTVLVGNDVSQALFSTTGQTKAPFFNLIRPDGSLITPNTIDPDIEWITDNQTLSFYVVRNPAPGNWIADIQDSPEVLNAYTARAASSISLAAGLTSSTAADSATASTSATSQAAGKISIQLTANDPGNNAKIGLYYDTDNQGADGVKIVDGLTAADAGKPYTWDTAYVPSGEYYVYAVVTDDTHVPIIAYASTKVLVEEPSAPSQPQGFLIQPFANAASLTWNANSERDLVGYMIHLTDDVNRVDYKQALAVGQTTSFVLGSLEPNKRYRVAVTAENKDGKSSRYSEPQLFTTQSLRIPSVTVLAPNGGESR